MAKKTKMSYRAVQYGKRSFGSASDLIRYLLKLKTKRTQAEIAEICGVTPALVSQINAEDR